MLGPLFLSNLQCPDFGGSRDYDAVNAELEEVSRKISLLRDELDSTQEKLMKFEQRLNDLERRKNALLNEKLAIERRSVERAKMEAKRQELEESVTVADSSIGKIEEELKPLADEIRDSNLARSKLVTERDSKVRELKQEIERVQKFEVQVSAVQKQISDYVGSNNEATLTK